MIYTFYGYKGGVGRTLALAHAASLLASTRAHTSARVLVIDLDLEAPGSIETLLPPTPGTALPQRGFSELIHDYMRETRDAAWIGRRIEEDAYPAAKSLFVFRSGSRERAAFLEASRLLPEAYTAGFFDQLRKACDAYEYVLVDSRTGLADVANAATVLIGDILVACFRPNEANLGIGEVIRNFLAKHRYSKDDPSAPVVPVLTPRPAHYSAETRELAKRFKDEFFGPHEIIQLPFDPALQVGERLLIPVNAVTLTGYGGGIANVAVGRDEANKEIDIDAPLLTAYVALMDRLALFNTGRDLVAAQQAEEMAFAAQRYREALEYRFDIIRREPSQRNHWRTVVPRYEFFLRADPGLKERLKTFLDAALSEGERAIEDPLGRAWAHLIRAQMFRVDSPAAAQIDCEEALRLASGDEEIINLGWVMKARAVDRPSSADPALGDTVSSMVEDSYETILKHLDAAMEGLGPSPAVYVARAETLAAMSRWEEAAEAYEKAAHYTDSPAEALVSAGRAFEQVGRYGEALRRYRTAGSFTTDRDLFRRLAYLHASLGHFAAAVEITTRWMALRRDDSEAHVTLINVRLAEHDLDAAVNAIHEMETRGFFVTRSLRVALAIRQRLFSDAARIAGEDPTDVRSFLRCLALLGAGADASSVVNLDGRPEDAPPIAIAGILAGYHRARPALKRLRLEASRQPAKWLKMLQLAESLLMVRRGSDHELQQFIAETTADPEMAIYLRNQLEIRLAFDLCESAPERIGAPLVDGMKRLRGAWDAIPARPREDYRALELDRRDSSPGTIRSPFLSAATA
jgi:tetratricopeptide (TPR) repeat protein/cellulose biosynthesis protein BcsQ